VLKAARSVAAGRVIAVVQPHRFTRLRDLFDQFCACFNDADTVIVASVYPAGEAPIEGIDRDALVEGLRGGDPADRPFRQSQVDAARKAAKEEGLGDRLSFAAATAKTFPSNGYDLVCFFDCLHDMGDPVGALKHVVTTMAEDGTCMLVEPFANDKLEQNLNPVGSLFYAASTMICTPASMAQEVGLALGAQAGEARLRDVANKGGLTRFRRAAETPFNLILEARA